MITITAIKINPRTSVVTVITNSADPGFTKNNKTADINVMKNATRNNV